MHAPDSSRMKREPKPRPGKRLIHHPRKWRDERPDEYRETLNTQGLRAAIAKETSYSRASGVQASHKSDPAKPTKQKRHEAALQEFKMGNVRGGEPMTQKQEHYLVHVAGYDITDLKKRFVMNRGQAFRLIGAHMSTGKIF